MDLCSNGHDEVCYESVLCPACALAAERDKAIEEAEGRDKIISVLNDTLSDANERIAALNQAAEDNA